MSSPSTRKYDQTLEIAASRETVWQAISQDTQLRRWFAPQASVTPGVGGEVTWTWEGLHNWPQTIEIWEPGSRLKTRYDSPVSDGGGGRIPLFMDFQLSGEGGTTMLRFVHSGFGPDADFDGEYDGISRGWPVELRSLQLYCERHFGQDRHLTLSRMNVEIDPGEAWRQVAGTNGVNCGAEIDQLSIGEAFDFTTADGDRFAGTALHCQPREFSGIATNHGDAFIRLTVEDCGGYQAWLWLASYGEPTEAVRGLKSRWDKLLARVLGGVPVAGGSQA